MKLTKSDRAAFVTAVMNDVPEVNHTEQARKLMVDAAVAKLPHQVQTIWKNNSLRGFIRCDHYVSTPYGLRSINTPLQGSDFMTPALEKRLKALAEASKLQKTKRAELESSVAGIIAGCSTLKQAKERLPEFVKYLPADRGGATADNLPAIANVVGALVKSGWPKDKK